MKTRAPALRRATVRLACAAAAIVLFLGPVTSLHSAPLEIRTQVGWIVAQGTGPSDEALLVWDVTSATEDNPQGCYVKDALGALPNKTPQEIGQAIADQVNQKVRAQCGITEDIARVDPNTGNVLLNPLWKASIGKGTTKTYFKLATDTRDLLNGIPLPMKLSIQPDPNSGEESLSELGSFGIESSLGYSSYFSAPAGTTNEVLAGLFADSINSLPGYAASATGYNVQIAPPPVDTQLYFLVDGEPFEYQLGVVPEPSTLALGVIGGIALLMFITVSVIRTPNQLVRWLPMLSLRDRFVPRR